MTNHIVDQRNEIASNANSEVNELRRITSYVGNIASTFEKCVDYTRQELARPREIASHWALGHTQQQLDRPYEQDMPWALDMTDEYSVRRECHNLNVDVRAYRYIERQLKRLVIITEGANVPPPIRARVTDAIRLVPCNIQNFAFCIAVTKAAYVLVRGYEPVIEEDGAEDGAEEGSTSRGKN